MGLRGTAVPGEAAAADAIEPFVEAWRELGPHGAVAACGGDDAGKEGGMGRGDEQLRRPDAPHLGGGGVEARDLEQAEVARRDVERRDGHDVGLTDGGDGERDEVVVGARLERLVVGHEAGRDDAGHAPLDHPFGAGRVFELVADGHMVALRDEAADVAVRRMVGDARHGDGVGLLRPRGEHEVELTRGEHRVVKEELVEVAHAEEEDGVRVGRLCLGMLAHGRRQFVGRGRHARRLRTRAQGLRMPQPLRL